MNFPMIRSVPYMGVIWVVHEASKLGFYNGHPDWCNLGQGQPEVGELEGAPERVSSLRIQPGDHAYGPVGGTLEAREAVAELYNRSFRRGMRSKYTADNVSIASGGRLALTRLFSIFSDGTRLLFKNPDYTAYEDYLNYQRHHCELVEVCAGPEDSFSVPADKLERVVRERGIQAFAFSNPCIRSVDLIGG